jgi:hypothetical protein
MSEMHRTLGNQVLLTSDQVRGWQEELQRWEAKKKEAEARIADLNRKLEAASFLSGVTFPPPVSVAAVNGDQDQGSMGDAVKRLLGELDRPARPAELNTLLQKIPKFRESLEKNPAYLYTVIARLKVKGDVKKAGKRIKLAHKDEAPSEGTPEGAPKSTAEG